MQVEQCIIEKTADPETGRPQFQITSRVWLACELTGDGSGAFIEVRLLEAGAGLLAGALLYLHSSKVRDS